MIKATIIFDNQFASSDNPIDYVKRNYISPMGLKESVYVEVKQDSTFPEVPIPKKLLNIPERLADFLRDHYDIENMTDAQVTEIIESLGEK